MLTGDERDTTLLTIGAAQTLARVGTAIFERSETSFRAYQRHAEAGEDADADGAMMALAVYLQELEALRERLRETHISESAERFARAVDSYLEDLAAGLKAAAEHRADDFWSASASREESATMMHAAFADLLGRLTSQGPD